MISNRTDDDLREEFKRRYLTEFTHYVGGLIQTSQEQSFGFLAYFLALFGMMVSGPLAVFLGGGILLRHAQVTRDVKATIGGAAQRLTDDLQSGTKTSLPSVERWLDRHIEDVPRYLDRLDREEEDRVRLRTLIERINRAGSADAVTADDRAFLKRRGVKKLKPPLFVEYPLPPRVQLGNWHFSQLDRALWSDITRNAGSRGSLLRRMLGIGGKKRA